MKNDLEKGARFKVGISVQNNKAEDIEKYVTICVVTALIE